MTLIINIFRPALGEFLYYGPPEPKEKSPSPPDCRITLIGQPAGSTFDPFDHTLLRITYSDGEPTHYLEGVPVPKDSNSNQNYDAFSAPSYLNGSDLSHPYYTGIRTDFSRTIIGAFNECDTLISLVDGFIAHRNNSITYSNGAIANFFAGPTSNSFTHSLLNAAGISIPLLWADLYVIAPGWKNTSVPF